MGNIPVMGVDPNGKWVIILFQESSAKAGSVFALAANIGTGQSIGNLALFSLNM
jgi:hypothetical protein